MPIEKVGQQVPDRCSFEAAHPGFKPQMIKAAGSNTNLIARILSGAWRSEPRAPDISVEELETVAPLLLGSGAGALGWCRVRDSELRSSSVAFQLHQAYRKHTLEAA